jgi:hypothetical protein
MFDYPSQRTGANIPRCYLRDPQSLSVLHNLFPSRCTAPMALGLLAHVSGGSQATLPEQAFMQSHLLVANKPLYLPMAAQRARKQMQHHSLVALPP